MTTMMPSDPNKEVKLDLRQGSLICYASVSQELYDMMMRVFHATPEEDWEYRDLELLNLASFLRQTGSEPTPNAIASARRCMEVSDDNRWKSEFPYLLLQDLDV